MRQLLISAVCCAAVTLTARSTHREAPSNEQVDFAPPLSDRPSWQDAMPRPDPPLAEGNQSQYEVNGVLYTVYASARGYREQGVFTALWVPSILAFGIYVKVSALLARSHV